MEIPKYGCTYYRMTHYIYIYRLKFSFPCSKHFCPRPFCNKIHPSAKHSMLKSFFLAVVKFYLYSMHFTNFHFPSVETLIRKNLLLEYSIIQINRHFLGMLLFFSPTSTGRSKVHRSILVQFVDQLQRTARLATFLMGYN